MDLRGGAREVFGWCQRGGVSGRKRCRYGSFCVMASIAGTPCFPGVPTGLDEISGPRGPARLARGRSSGFALLRDYLSYSCGSGG